MYGNDNWRSPSFGAAFETPYDNGEPLPPSAADWYPGASVEVPGAAALSHPSYGDFVPVVRGKHPGLYGRPAMGVALPAEVELGPTTLRAINDLRRTADTQLDKAINEVSAGLRLLGLSFAIAGVAIGVGLALKK